MNFEILQGMPTVTFNALFVLGIGALSFLLGGLIKAKVTLFQQLSFPVPFLGGLPVALACCFLKVTGTLHIVFDPTVPQVALKFFMCSLALFGSWKLLKGSIFFASAFWLLATVLGALQSGFGIVFAKILGLDPLYGMLMGAVSLMGGMETYHQFAASFDVLTSEDVGGIVLGAGTLGILMALSLGAPFGEWMIRRYKLTNRDYPESNNRFLEYFLSSHPKPFYQYLSKEVIRTFALVCVSVALGDLLSDAVLAWMTLPKFLAGMIVAILLRIGLDVADICLVESLALRTLTKATLTMFIATNVCALQLDSLANLRWEMCVILAGQLVLNLLFARFGYFMLLGRNYDAMMLSVGGVGFSMGITANGLSNMQSLCEKYGPCMRTIFIVSVVGTILIGLTNSLTVGWMLSYGFQ